MIESVRIFIASTPAEWLPMRMLDYSIRESTSSHVDISAIYKFNRAIPIPSVIDNRPRTPFSFQRFLIPELCNYTGKAIYLDADMQVFHDIRDIWDQEFGDCDLQTVKASRTGRLGQFSVMLLDCEALKWDIDQIVADLDKGKLSYENLMYEMRVASKIGMGISPEWNSLEKFVPEKTRLLHYTDMNTQPWISILNPLGSIWIKCLRRALHDGFVTRDELEKEVALGHVRPSLLAQINSDLNSSIVLPSSIRKLDRSFIPPYRSLQSGKASPWTSFRSAATSFIRRSYYRSPLPRIFK